MFVCLLHVFLLPYVSQFVKMTTVFCVFVRLSVTCFYLPCVHLHVMLVFCAFVFLYLSSVNNEFLYLPVHIACLWFTCLFLPVHVMAIIHTFACLFTCLQHTCLSIQVRVLRRFVYPCVLPVNHICVSRYTSCLSAELTVDRVLLCMSVHPLSSSCLCICTFDACHLHT